MRKFHVVVNGETFEVEIEEVKNAGQNAAGPAPVKIAADVPKAPPAQPAATKPAAPKPAASGAANEVTSPLPGTILNVIAKEGQDVQTNELVLIVEAMKMENEIVAPFAGTIQGIHVKKGDSVQAGDLLFTLK
ncbi:biotin/lipoyl-containing protein [Dehalobacterium formicoaceticum]|uniref:Biotin/lipoyl-binding protein n=1 Tax=Dehalobacterium formicoaceticum TaxID=51515 RepID=A0ABT1Y627_9FIRM|nr:biotin/lipoyl-containing protein [Dehalobacterium formicoaceticum]MCR6546333.1 biotin/lipoyl-binding protein [Dehalobacterium formicoaceticum]